MNISSPNQSQEHENHPNIMSDNPKSKIISKQSCHSEEISPVMCLFAHTSYERKWSSWRIRDIECYIRQILPKPPESDTRSEWILFLEQKSIHHNYWYQTLTETSTKNIYKFSERHKDNMSSLMKYQIRSMDERIHHFSIYPKGEKLERIVNQKNPKYNSN